MSDHEYRIPARIDELAPADDTFAKQDPFNKSWDDLKVFEGLDNNFKRRAKRISKTEVTQG